jgi:hypothetical protein
MCSFIKNDPINKKGVLFKGFYILSTGGHFVKQTGTILAIIGVEHPRIIPE